MEALVLYLPLLNLLWTALIVPAFKLIKNQQVQIQAQKLEIDELKKWNKSMAEEITLVKQLVYSTIDANKLREHLINKLQPNDKK